MFRISASLIAAVLAVLSLSAPAALHAADAPAEKAAELTLKGVTGVMVATLPGCHLANRGYQPFGHEAVLSLSEGYQMLVVYVDVEVRWFKARQRLYIAPQDLQLTSPKHPYAAGDAYFTRRRDDDLYRLSLRLTGPRFEAENIRFARTVESLTAPSPLDPQPTATTPYVETRTLGPYVYAVPIADLEEPFTLHLYDQEARVEMGAPVPTFAPAEVLAATITGATLEAQLGRYSLHSNDTVRITELSRPTQDRYLLLSVAVDPKLPGHAYASGEFAVRVDERAATPALGTLHQGDLNRLNTATWFTSKGDEALHKQTILLVFRVPPDFKKLELFWLNAKLATYTP